MALQDRWRILTADEAPSEIARLLSLPGLDRKLELACSPPIVVVSDLNWIFVDVLNPPEDFGGRFAVTMTDPNEVGWLLVATKISDRWVWQIFRNGTELCASGEHSDMATAFAACSVRTIELKSCRGPSFNTINANRDQLTT